jgi:hypothetical protein
MKDDTNWLQTKDVPPNHRHHCSNISTTMSPLSQGYESTRTVPECTWVPKPFISQALTGFLTPTTIQVPNSLLPSLCHLREWSSTLLYHAVPQVVLLLPTRASSTIWSRISMLELSGLTIMGKTGNMPMHFRHAGPRSWLDHTSDHYIQLSHG